MAITFKAHEGKPVKEPQSKFNKVRKILFVLAIIATVLLVLYLLAPLAPVLLALPLLIFWLFIVLFPTVITFGTIWVSSGYQSFVGSLNNAIDQAFNSLDQGVKIIQDSLPIAGSISLVIVASYAIMSFFIFKKDKSKKTSFIISLILLVIAIVFFIVDIVYYK